jgi:hypothetical protein
VVSFSHKKVNIPYGQFAAVKQGRSSPNQPVIALSKDRLKPWQDLRKYFKQCGSVDKSLRVYLDLSSQYARFGQLDTPGSPTGSISC